MLVVLKVPSLNCSQTPENYRQMKKRFKDVFSYLKVLEFMYLESILMLFFQKKRNLDDKSKSKSLKESLGANALVPATSNISHGNTTLVTDGGEDLVINLCIIVKFIHIYY